MFKDFLDFVGYENSTEIKNAHDFIRLLNGKSFLNGMYRLFSTQDIEKWTAITEEAFHPTKVQYRCLAMTGLAEYSH